MITEIKKVDYSDINQSHLRGGTRGRMHPVSEWKKNKGQALLELAVFGSIILMLLGVLISYGMRYNFQQQADMQAFRKAMELACRGDDYGHTSYMLIKERHIPDPSNPFGAGQVTPIMASASVSRDSKMDHTADDYEGLPKMMIQFQGKENGVVVQSEEFEYATAGLRHEQITIPGTKNSYEELQKKYYLIYDSIGGWCKYKDEDEFDDECAGEPNTLTIVDSVEGQIVDYSSAIRQARVIVDEEFCIQECERGKKPDSDTNCGDVCGWSIEEPWYVAGCGYVDGKMNCPQIENLFVYGGKRVQAMGVQSDYVQETTTDFIMTKSEDASGISTTDDINWGTETTRTILYNDHLDKSGLDGVDGYAQENINLATEEYTSTWSYEGSSGWETEGWE